MTLSGHNEHRHLFNETLARTRAEESTDEHLLRCPNCFSSAMRKLQERSTVECKKCHAPLGSREFAEKLSECPFCHGKEAQKKER